MSLDDRTRERAAIKARFLVELRKVGTVYIAAQEAGVARATVYLWRDDDEDFAREWDEAVQRVYDRIEHSLYERAVEGVLEPVFYQGDECGHVRKYSDTAAIYLLNGGRSEKYRHRHELSGPGGGPIQVKGLEVTVVDSRDATTREDK